MYRFLVTLHVLFAVFLTGPAALVPFVALTPLVAVAPERVRLIAKRTFQLGAATLLIAVTGVIALAQSNTYRFGTPWVTISMTVYVIAAIITIAVLPRVLSRTAKHLEESLAASPADPDTPNDPETVAVSTAMADQQRGRLVSLALLALVLYGVAAVMMAFKPFGD